MGIIRNFKSRKYSLRSRKIDCSTHPDWRYVNKTAYLRIYLHKDPIFRGIHISCYSNNGDYHATEADCHYGYVRGRFQTRGSRYAETLFLLFKRYILNSPLSSVWEQNLRKKSIRINQNQVKRKRTIQNNNKIVKKNIKNNDKTQTSRARIRNMKIQAGKEKSRNLEKNIKNTLSLGREGLTVEVSYRDTIPYHTIRVVFDLKQSPMRQSGDELP